MSQLFDLINRTPEQWREIAEFRLDHAEAWYHRTDKRFRYCKDAEQNMYSALFDVAIAQHWADNPHLWDGKNSVPWPFN